MLNISDVNLNRVYKLKKSKNYGKASKVFF